LLSAISCRCCSAAVYSMWRAGHVTVCLSCVLILSGATTRRAGALPMGASVVRGTGSDRPRMPELLRDDRSSRVSRQQVGEIQHQFIVAENTVFDERASLSACLSAYLRNHTCEPDRLFYACFSVNFWHRTLQCVIYFRFVDDVTLCPWSRRDSSV